MSWQEKLLTLGRLKENEPFAAHTTLAIGGPARWFFRPEGKAELAEALAAVPEDVAVMPLGRGSNLLVCDEGFDGLVIDLSDINHIEVNGDTLTAGAGSRMSKVARQCANHGLTGLEFMATVPGDVGGGIAMNAGAFGQQVSDLLQQITILHRDGREEMITADKLDMSYRYTRLPSGSLVVSATFRLDAGDSDTIRSRMREIREKRSASQPLAQPNCGSVFKNPDNDHAARLIEAAGLKGTRIGNARISGTHANFIINEGGASCEDVLALIALARKEVKEKFSIQLEPEVRLLGASYE